MGRVICLTPAAFYLHSGEDSSARDNAQELNAAQPAHGAYLRSDADRATERQIPIAIEEPSAEQGAVVFDSGKWLAFPKGEASIGRFESTDDAQAALRKHREGERP